VQIIRPILRGRDIKRYVYEWAGKWVINTHNGYKDEDITISPINIKDYPRLKLHLDSFWSEISKRSDKGHTPYNLRHCAYMSEFNRQKIVYSEIVQSPQFYLDKNNFYAEATSFILTGNFLEYLIGMLHSKLLAFAFKNFYAGGGLGEKGYRYKKAFLELLPIPKITESKQQEFVKIVNEILESKAKNQDAKALQEVLDKMVYTLYNLNDKEIELIESSFN
ncbi:TaqI-like C-terminal specificity domain-containing protein, partial [Helicobacter sp. faydin-H76]